MKANMAQSLEESQNRFNHLFGGLPLSQRPPKLSQKYGQNEALIHDYEQRYKESFGKASKQVKDGKVSGFSSMKADIHDFPVSS